MTAMAHTGDALGQWQLRDAKAVEGGVQTFAATDAQGREATVLVRRVGALTAADVAGLMQRISVVQELARPGTETVGGRHLPEIFEYGVVEDVLFVAQARCRGRSLASIQQQEGLFGPFRAVGYARQVAALMTGLHARGLVLGHLDLSQIWVCSEACTGDLLTVSNAALDEHRPSESDVCVLANVIVRLMTGRDGPDVPVEIPRALKTVLVRGCASDVSRRFESPRDLVEAAWSTLMPTPPGRPKPPSRPGPWRLEYSVGGIAGETVFPAVDTARLDRETADQIAQALVGCDFWGEHEPDGIACAYWHLTVTAADGSRHTHGSVLGLDPLISLVRQQATTRTLTGHTDLICDLIAEPDGRHIVSCSYDGMVRFWDRATGTPVNTVTLKETSLALARSPAGLRVVTRSRKDELRVRDVLSGKQICALGRDSQLVSSAALTPDGRWLVTGSVSTNSVCVWDLTTGKTLGMLEHKGEVTGVAVSPVGGQFFSLTEDGAVRVWDLASGQLIRTMESNGYADGAGLAVSPDGAFVSSSYQKDVRVWDVASGQLIAALSGHTGPVLSLAFAPDGRRLVSGSMDMSVRVWDVMTGQLRRTLTGHFGPTTAVAFGADNWHVISGSYDRTVRIWEVV